MKFLISTAALGGLLCTSALAGDITTPDGFNVETDPSRGHLFALLSDGSLLRSTGSFGAEQLKRVYSDGSSQIFADGIGSLAGFAISDASGDMVVGDSFGASSLWLLQDLNDDGDVLDPGERSPFPVQPPVQPNGFDAVPFALAYAPGTDELYMSASTFGSPPDGTLLRFDGNAWSPFADGFDYPGGLLFTDNGLLMSETFAFPVIGGRVVRFVDGNNDGDAMDPGEQNDYASGLSGTSSLVMAMDGSIYSSGASGCAEFKGCVDRLLPDANQDGMADGVEPCIFGEFPVVGMFGSFTANMTLVEGDAGFGPGAGSDGTLYVREFDFQGDYTIRSAPLAQTFVDGTVAQNEDVDVTVQGTPFADGLFIMSLDTVGATIPGIGDLCLGFADISVISPVFPLDQNGVGGLTIPFREYPSLVGQTIVFQGLTLENGEFGIGNALDFVFGE